MKNEDHFIVKRLLADEITRIAYHNKKSPIAATTGPKTKVLNQLSN